MHRTMMHAVAALTLAMLGASHGIAADRNMFRDLPGVLPPKGFSTQSDQQPDCTTRLVSPYYHGRRQMPMRMYSCKNGLVTYESTISPGFNPPAGDPYLHGENMRSFPGTPN